MTGAHDVFIQLEEVPTQGVRDVHLGSTVQRGDTHEEPFVRLVKAQMLVLVHLIPCILAPLEIFLRSDHACQRDRLLLVQLPIVKRDPATGILSKRKAGNIFRDDRPVERQRREARHGVGTVVLPSRPLAYLVPKYSQAEAPASDPFLCAVHVQKPA